MDNSLSLWPNNDCKINATGMLRTFHPLGSLDLSPCNFRAIEMLKQKKMDRHLQSAEEIQDMTRANEMK
jgi:hypothetical protein